MACEQQRDDRDRAIQAVAVAQGRIDQKDQCCLEAGGGPDDVERCLQSDDTCGLPSMAKLEQERDDAVSRRDEAQRALAECLATATEIRSAQGSVNFIDVRDVGQGFGPLDDRLDDIEVAFKLDEPLQRFFAFSLRNDQQGAVHRAYLEAVRESFNTNRILRITFLQRFKANGTPRLNNKVITIIVSK